MFGSGRFGRKGQGFGRREVSDTLPEDENPIDLQKNADATTSQEDALSVLKTCMDRICEGILDDDSRADFIAGYDPAALQNAQVFDQDGVKQFSILGHLVPPSSVDHGQHETLFWLANDLNMIQLFHSNPLARSQPATNDRIVLQNLKVAVHSAYLSSYCQLALEHCERGLFAEFMEAPGAVLSKMEPLAEAEARSYRRKLDRIGGYSQAYETGLKDMQAIGKLPEIPIVPVILGHRLEDGILLNIYMDPENGERMQNHLAAQQSWGRAENNGYFG